jgi:hypothetical protein
MPLARWFGQFECNTAQAFCLCDEHRCEYRLDELNDHVKKDDALLFQETTYERLAIFAPKVGATGHTEKLSARPPRPTGGENEIDKVR